MVLCVIYCGLTQLTMEKTDSTRPLEVLDTVGARILVINLCTGIALKWYAEHTSW